jgi:2-polyprenyl-3-methyl-5-hydroxy-6-metoxy-1,4-benzoquinol methylase
MKTGEYLEKGDYHKNPDKNWPFYPVYIEKMRMIENFLEENGCGKKILDLGCGEGVLVDKFKSQGYDIIGADANYGSENVLKKNILETGFEEGRFDIIFCLDVLEHLSFENQDKALAEIKRILKKDGLLILTLPNLAHFASRLSFLFAGKLIRTSKIERHPGDRPIKEFINLIKNNDLKITKRKGLFPTFPLLALFTYYFPGRIVWWHRIANKLFAYPNWCFLNFIVCKNEK